MKPNKTTTALLILVLIFLNIIALNCEQIKNTRSNKLKYRRNKMTRSNSRTKNFIFDKLQKSFTDPKNILYFTFGVAAEFSSESEPLYHKLKKSIDAFSPCFDVMNLAFKFVKESKEADNLAKLGKSESIKLLESTLAKKENQKEYCEKTKKQISENFIKSTWESEANRSGFYGGLIDITPNILLSLSYGIAEKIVSLDEYCYRPTNIDSAPKTAEELKKKFTNLDVYYNQCMYFNSLDCNIFNPETTGVWEFIKKSYSYYGMVKKTGTCIANLVNGPDSVSRWLKFKPVGDLFKAGGFFYKALATTLGVVTNLLTLGIWGGIKGGYYLIELGLMIKEFKDDITEDLAFKTGKIIGKGIAIAKSLLLGRRKLYRRMRK